MVLDGLDEVPPANRALLRETIKAGIKLYKVARVIVTCRILSYTGDARLNGFADFELAGFTRDQIRNFAYRWYRARARMKVEGLTKKEADDRGQRLATAALQPDLLKLSENPLLMTTMAIVHQEERDLPRERVMLFKRAIKVLLLRWQEHKVRTGNPPFREAGRSPQGSKPPEQLPGTTGLRSALHTARSWQEKPRRPSHRSAPTCRAGWHGTSWKALNTLAILIWPRTFWTT
ncbi:MAG: hypothetical protein IPL60_18435 [Ardenticatenia bacterium]|nr:hypothetical protein [Ardenticatenia bacterium]